MRHLPSIFQLSIEARKDAAVAAAVCVIGPRNPMEIQSWDLSLCGMHPAPRTRLRHRAGLALRDRPARRTNPGTPARTDMAPTTTPAIISRDPPDRAGLSGRHKTGPTGGFERC